MKNILKYILVFMVLVLLVGIGYTAYLSKPLFSEMRSEHTPLPVVAEQDKAVTFARTENSLLLVTDIQSSKVKAIDLTSFFGAKLCADPVRLYQMIGHDSLARLKEPEVIIDVENLLLPLDFGGAHLAAGTNYAEHSREVMLDDPPFLFPKNVQPTTWNAPVNFTKRLDYEAELAFVPLTAIASADEVPPYGLILTNDFTDRWTLINELKLRKPMGTTGFAASKGQESFLPTGHFLVIPKDRTFYKNIELRLYVNDRLRQSFSAEEMILKYEDIVTQSFSDREMVYKNGKSIVPLIPEDGIERGSLLLSGTAGGVIFKPANIWRQGLYLKPGDIVRTEASYLGFSGE